MSKSNLFQHEIPTSTSERMLGFFKNFFIFVSRAHIKSHKDFNDTVLRELDDLKSTRTIIVNRTKQMVNGGLKDIHHAEDAVEKAKKAFAKAKADYERGVEKLKALERAVIEHQRALEEKKKENLSKDPSKFSMGRMFQSAFEAHPEQDRDKQIKKVERRHDDMISAANAIIDRKRQLLTCMDALDRYLQEAAAVFQELEVDRMRRLKNMMRRFCDSERAILKAKEEHLCLLEESISFQEPEEDMLLYITQEKLTEATHKYSGAVKLLDEYLYRRRENNDWSFTTCDEYHVADHAQLIASITSSVDVPSNALSESPDLDNHRLAESESSTPIPLEMSPSEASPVDKESAVLSALQQPLNEALESIFASPSSPTESASSKSLVLNNWEELLSTEEARRRFLQFLDDKRCVSACLNDEGYNALSIAMQCLLTYCEDSDDAKSAMRVLNMANTFYMPAKVDESSLNERESASVHEPVVESAVPPASVEHAPNEMTRKRRDPAKCYLQADVRLKRHPIWRKQNFWENAMKEGVFVEMAKLQPSHWDELSQESLKETVINIHNLVFGQLGTLSFTMREQSGLERREVASHVLVMSRKFQLCEDQEFDLLHNITNQVIKEYQPPPIIPNAPVAGHHDGTDADFSTSFMMSNANMANQRRSISNILSGGGSSSSTDNAAVFRSSDIVSYSELNKGNAYPNPPQQHQLPHHHHHHHHHRRPSSEGSSSSSTRGTAVVVEGTATVVGSGGGGLMTRTGVQQQQQSSSNSGTSSRRGSQNIDTPVVVSATVISNPGGFDSAASSSHQHNDSSRRNSSSGSHSSSPVAVPGVAASSAPSSRPGSSAGATSSSNPLSFMLGSMSGDSGSGKRSRTASQNHDDFYATL